jgi:hypothetical protein
VIHAPPQKPKENVGPSSVIGPDFVGVGEASKMLVSRTTTEFKKENEYGDVHASCTVDVMNSYFRLLQSWCLVVESGCRDDGTSLRRGNQEKCNRGSDEATRQVRFHKVRYR